MKYVKTTLILYVMTAGCLVQQSAQAQNKVSNSVFGNGAAVLSSSNNRLIGTIGQSAIGVAGNSSNKLGAGYWYQVEDFVTSVEQIPAATVPKEFRLDQNYPNPFNPATTIQFALPKRSQVTLTLFDLLGREVATLVDEELQPGEFEVMFDASGLASGVYLYRLRADGFVRTRKLTLLK